MSMGVDFVEGVLLAAPCFAKRATLGSDVSLSAGGFLRESKAEEVVRAVNELAVVLPR